jgi:hypothetical protein
VGRSTGPGARGAALLRSGRGPRRRRHGRVPGPACRRVDELGRGDRPEPPARSRGPGRRHHHPRDRPSQAGRGGAPAHGRDRQLLARRHHRQDAGRHRDELEPGRRTDVRVHGRGSRRDGRPRAAPAAYHAEIDVILARIRSGESVDRYKTVRLRKDGRPIRVALQVSPLLDETARSSEARSSPAT